MLWATVRLGDLTSNGEEALSLQPGTAIKSPVMGDRGGLGRHGRGSICPRQRQSRDCEGGPGQLGMDRRRSVEGRKWPCVRREGHTRTLAHTHRHHVHTHTHMHH